MLGCLSGATHVAGVLASHHLLSLCELRTAHKHCLVLQVYSAAVYLFGHICGAHYTLDIDEIKQSVVSLSTTGSLPNHCSVPTAPTSLLLSIGSALWGLLLISLHPAERHDELSKEIWALQEAVHNGLVGWDEHHFMMRVLKAFLRAPKNISSKGSRNKHALDFFLHTLHPLKAERMTAADALMHKLFSRPADQTDSLADLAASLLRVSA